MLLMIFVQQIMACLKIVAMPVFKLPSGRPDKVLVRIVCDEAFQLQARHEDKKGTKVRIDLRLPAALRQDELIRVPH